MCESFRFRIELCDVNKSIGCSLGGRAASGIASVVRVRWRRRLRGGRGACAQGGPAQSARALAMARWLQALVALLALASAGAARKSQAHVKQEPQIEEVTAKQLERVLEEKDFVAVYWCKCGRESRRVQRANSARASSPVYFAAGARPARGRTPPCRNVCDGARPNGLSSS